MSDGPTRWPDLAGAFERAAAALRELSESDEAEELRRREAERKKANKRDDRVRHHLDAARKRMREREADDA